MELTGIGWNYRYAHTNLAGIIDTHTQIWLELTGIMDTHTQIWLELLIHTHELPVLLINYDKSTQI